MKQETIDIVKSTVPVLEEHGEAITKQFYLNLFASHPELRNVFNQTNQKKNRQQKALANAVYQAAKHIDNLGAILPVVNQIAQKHRSIGIQPEHYPIVGENLLQAIKDVLSEAATEEIITAWAEAYDEIADAFINVENHLREDVLASGGWEGYRPLKVVKKVKESDVITSFYLQCEDAGPLPSYSPGQYLSIKADIPGEPITHIRQYSLSDAPNKNTYRISVKREDAIGENPDGVVSHYLHDVVQEGDTLYFSAPAGDFTLNAKEEKPLVLIAGGVGLTPLMSMLNTATKEKPSRDIIWIQAAVNGHVHAFSDHVHSLADEHDNLSAYVCYEKPTQDDRAAGCFQFEGYLNAEKLDEAIPDKNADYYFCGPKPFMQAIYTILKNWDIPEENIHFEFFGPQDELVEQPVALGV